MRVDVYNYSNKLNDHRISNSTVVVVDVLRATTSIIWAIKNGAEKVVPAQDPGEAAAMAIKLGSRECVLAGERGGVKMPGFHLGNTPMDFTGDIVSDKTVIISTTNGTEAICGVRSAKNVLIGAMINRTAVAKSAVEFGNDIIIMCAGTEGQLSADDVCAAGAIVEAVSRVSEGGAKANDLALIACLVYSDWVNGNADLSDTMHYSRLVRLGFEEDVEFCFKADVTDVVPVFKNGIITNS